MSCEEWLYGFITNLGFCEVSRARKNIGAKTWTTFNQGMQVWYWYIPTERAEQ